MNLPRGGATKLRNNGFEVAERAEERSYVIRVPKDARVHWEYDPQKEVSYLVVELLNEDWNSVLISASSDEAMSRALDEALEGGEED